MTTSNRATKYESLYKSLKKHFKPASEAPERSVLEHLLYACCLEDARSDQADEAFAKLQQAYFDWNEVRVTTTSELGESLQSLSFASQAAARIKQCLQALFESRYQYDLEDMKKANLGKAVAELEAWKGMSPFVVSYVSQQALGGHSIPISNVILQALLQCEIINPAEADKKTVPGLERAIAKNKGIEFGSLLQQFAMELHAHPKSGPVQSVLKDLGVTYKPKPKMEPKAAESQRKATSKGAQPMKPKLAVDTKPKAIEPLATSSPKKVDGKKGIIEEPHKPEKPSKKGSDKKEVPPKNVAKPVTTKKMAPPATKDKPTAPPSTAKNKKGAAEEATSKRVPPKPDKKDSKGAKDSKAKPPTKSKSVGTPTKRPDGSKGAKPAGTGKSSAGSIASNLTKKKPK